MKRIIAIAILLYLVLGLCSPLISIYQEETSKGEVNEETDICTTETSVGIANPNMQIETGIVEETYTYPDPNAGKIYDTPTKDSFKPFMDYRKITVRNSPHYALQQIACTDPKTGIRMVDGRYCMAVGSYYTTKIGIKIDVVLATGIVIKGILADCKADIHTDPETHRQNPNGSVVEFVVDKCKIADKVYLMGDCSWANEDWKGDIDYIIVYEEE